MGIHPIQGPDSLSDCELCGCKLCTDRQIYFKLAAFFARELENRWEKPPAASGRRNIFVYGRSGRARYSFLAHPAFGKSAMSAGDNL